MQNNCWPPAALLLACFLLFVPYVHSVDGQCVSFQELGKQLPDSQLKCAHVCPSEKGWKAVPVLWAPLNVDINCSTNSYTVLTANTEQQLIAGNATPVKWCGFNNILHEPRICSFTLSPLRDHFFAVDAGESGGMFAAGPPSLSCAVNSSRQLSLRHMALTVLGVALFFNAAQLTMSATFRLTSGSLMFMSGAVLVLVCVLMRSVPYKRSLMAFFTVSASSLLAVVRWLYGTWLPDAHSLLTSRPFVIYLVVSGLLGLAVTYWVDDTTNVKLNTTIRVTLQLVGLLMVYLGISDERVAIAAIVLLVFSGVLLAVGRRVGQLALLIARHLGRLLWWALRSTWHVAVSTMRAAVGIRPHRAAALSAEVDSSAPAGVSAGWRKAARAGRQGAAGDDDLMLSDEEDAAAADRHYRRPQQQQQQGVVLAGAPAMPLSKLPSLNDWQSPSARAAGEPLPLHLRQRPPLSPVVLACQPDLQQQQWRQREVVQVQQQGQGSGDTAAAYGEDGGYMFPSSTPPSRPPTSTPATKSAWSRERVVVDVRNRPVSPPQPAAAAARTTASSPAAAAGQEQPVSPLVAAGRIINPETGRPILINKAKYNELLNLGYQPDLQNGVLVPPSGALAGGSRPSAQSPPSNARQRRPRSGGQ